MNVEHLIEQAKSYAERRRQADDANCARFIEKLVVAILVLQEQVENKKE